MEGARFGKGGARLGKEVLEFWSRDAYARASSASSSRSGGPALPPAVPAAKNAARISFVILWKGRRHGARTHERSMPYALQIVWRTERAHPAASRLDRITFARGNSATSASNATAAGKSTQAVKPSAPKIPFQSGVPHSASAHRSECPSRMFSRMW